MAKLDQKPRFWLTTKISKDIFNKFNHLIQFDQPIPPFHTRDKEKFESILSSVQQTFGGKLLNSTILDASAAYLNQIVRGHPFKNGNKRIAVLLTHVFLFFHGIDFTLSFKGMYNFVLLLAKESPKLANDQTKEICRKIIQNFTKEIN
ncbi:hypothetical protein COT64_00465 [Candidatus Shapirobacteria bacterium CG09_land_8_20_14_0_10_39_12]|uniref:Fido domain-containing protein n=1 Tax=Candidatus Shapirobacteria bacterium CG09_land_8_20_14_0_10_39_12 TaxID=1974885 RepID=A0A2H0WSG3_9BACT|nr:MAG: hypothetical protein COT64_00465 [Candidatus Shapirobacteria bacterium CG09_land_8_20_14_0_10_39_12]